MDLSFWARTSGTWINLLTVLTGTGLGLWLRGRLPQAMQQVITQGVGLMVIFIGFTLAGRMLPVQVEAVDGVIVALFALVSGGLLGEWLGIEARLVQVGDQLKQHFRGKGRFTEGFVTASLLFCVGPMALIGSLSNGLEGDDTLLVLKASMDGLVSIALTGSYGIGVGFSTLTILVYQGLVSVLAGALAQGIPDPSQSPPLLMTTGVGGLMVLGTGLNLLEITKIRVASFLPALAIAPLLLGVAKWLGFHASVLV